MGIMIRYTLLGGLNSTTMANANVTVDEWMELDTSVGQVEWVEVLTSKLSNCNYKSILLGSQRFVLAVVDAVEANGCRSVIAMRQGVDAACMAVPWLVCVGFGTYRELSLVFLCSFLYTRPYTLCFPLQ